MEIFKRQNKNSKLTLYTKEQFFESTQIIDVIENDYTILQIICFDDTILVEAISKLEEEMTAPCGQPQHDIDFENYLETIINKDPFGGKYSGKPIKQVFIDGNKDWLNKALTELKNEFLRDRLQYIMSRGGYGKICRV